MGMLVRIRAHYFGTKIDENKAEIVTILALISEDKKIIPGTYFGEIIELNESYPVRFESKKYDGKARFDFGHYGELYEDCQEAIYPTNLDEKEISIGEYFTVWNYENDELVYVIDHVVNMNSPNA